MRADVIGSRLVGEDYETFRALDLSESYFSLTNRHDCSTISFSELEALWHQFAATLSDGPARREWDSLVNAARAEIGSAAAPNWSASYVAIDQHLRDHGRDLTGIEVDVSVFQRQQAPPTACIEFPRRTESLARLARDLVAAPLAFNSEPARFRLRVQLALSAEHDAAIFLFRRNHKAGLGAALLELEKLSANQGARDLVAKIRLAVVSAENQIEGMAEARRIWSSSEEFCRYDDNGDLADRLFAYLNIARLLDLFHDPERALNGPLLRLLLPVRSKSDVADALRQIFRTYRLLAFLNREVTEAFNNADAPLRWEIIQGLSPDEKLDDTRDPNGVGRPKGTRKDAEADDPRDVKIARRLDALRSERPKGNARALREYRRRFGELPEGWLFDSRSIFKKVDRILRRQSLTQ